MASLSYTELTHLLFNSSPPSAAYMRQWIRSALFQVMACCLFCAKPLPEPMLAYCQLGTNFSEIWIGILSFSIKKRHLKLLSAKMAAILSKERWVRWYSTSNGIQKFSGNPNLVMVCFCSFLSIGNVFDDIWTSTHYGLMASMIWVNIGSCNGLLPILSQSHCLNLFWFIVS